MKNKKDKKTIIIKILIILFLVLLIVCEVLLRNIENEEEQKKQSTANIIAKEQSKTVKETIEKHDSTYLTRKANTIYVDFLEDLYDSNGESNEEYFESLIKDLSTTEDLKEKNFYLIDEEKDIIIHVKYDEENKYSIEYNRKENFYNEVDGKEYISVDKVNIVDQKEITVLAQELRDLTSGNMFFRKIKNKIGVGEDLGNGYTSYKDGALILKILNSKVRNAVFTEKYTNEIVTNVTVGMTLDEIKQKLNTPSKENEKKEYILYRTSELYIFFYEDEASAYGYSYFENNYFEEYLEQYLEDNDLDSFIQKVRGKYTMYDKNEYDAESQYAYITYPSLGIEIKIEANNPKGITLYNNYYFSEKTKDFAKDGKISVNADEDLLELMEQNRRNEFLEVRDV